jgi:hypothetical protein
VFPWCSSSISVKLYTTCRLVYSTVVNNAISFCCCHYFAFRSNVSHKGTQYKLHLVKLWCYECFTTWTYKEKSWLKVWNAITLKWWSVKQLFVYILCSKLCSQHPPMYTQLCSCVLVCVWNIADIPVCVPTRRERRGRERYVSFPSEGKNEMVHKTFQMYNECCDSLCLSTRKIHLLTLLETWPGKSLDSRYQTTDSNSF